MNPLAKLEQLNLEPAAKTKVAAILQALMDQTTADAKLIQAKDVKIAALTHELAYYKRIRFSTKSEALAPLQRDVFEETWNTDISAIEAEVEQLQDDQTGKTVTTSHSNAHVPDGNRYRIICRVSSTATNLSLALVDSAAKIWSKSAKT